MPRWKRAVDVTLCILALPVLALAAVVMTIMMKLVSPGPVIYRQERIGYLGRSFMLYKFRTMKVGADARIHQTLTDRLIDTNAPMVKMDHRGDSRLIPGARLIRASGLDELPQLINVLLGEMSLIGPRPCLSYEFEKFLPWQRERFSTLPGLTGLWQVSNRSTTSFDDMIRLDISYAHRKSWLLDLKILFLTFPTLAGQIRQACLRNDSGSLSRSDARLAPLHPQANSR